MKIAFLDNDTCCSNGTRTNRGISDKRTSRHSISEFFKRAKGLYPAALGIEILCIAAAELGENTGLYVLGFNHIGIPFAYGIGYSLASFTTFTTILGRYRYGSGDKINGCCSVLEQEGSKSFFSNLVTTFKNFGSGLKKLKDLPKQSNLREILKTTFGILITAESACIITAETVDLIFFKQAIYLSIPLALIACAFTVAGAEAYRKPRKGKQI